MGTGPLSLRLQGFCVEVRYREGGAARAVEAATSHAVVCHSRSPDRATTNELASQLVSTRFCFRHDTARHRQHGRGAATDHGGHQPQRPVGIWAAYVTGGAGCEVQVKLDGMHCAANVCDATWSSFASASGEWLRIHVLIPTCISTIH